MSTAKWQGFTYTDNFYSLKDISNAMRYYLAMINSFRCPDTEALCRGRRVKRFVQFERIALRKLRQLQVAMSLGDLKVPPGNRLEALKGKRKGQHSIRINDQFRICFRWSKAGANDMEIVDYH